MTLATAPRPRAALKTSRPRVRPWDTWPVPAALIALVLTPLIAGSLRLVEISGGSALLPANTRISDAPLPLILHVASSAVYAVVGAFQFPARLWRASRAWHRKAGRVTAGAGLVVAGSGLWMTLFYAGAPGGDLLWVVRLVVACVLAASIVLGITAIRRRAVAAHRAWMIRAYALAVAAGTQAFTQGIGEGFFGTGELSTALSVSAGWVLNAAVAEWVIRRPGVRPARRARIVAL